MYDKSEGVIFTFELKDTPKPKYPRGTMFIKKSEWSFKVRKVLKVFLTDSGTSYYEINGGYTDNSCILSEKELEENYDRIVSEA